MRCTKWALWGLLSLCVFAPPCLADGVLTEAAGGAGGGGGSGTVTSVSASGGVETTTGSAITGTGTIRGNMCVRAVTGTTDTVLSTDRGCVVTYSNASSIAVTLPEAGTAGFDAGFWFQPVNLGVGDVVVTPTTSTIQSEADLTLTTGKGTTIASDGTNYVHNPGLGLTAESQTIQNVFALGNEITGANSLANSLRVGDGTTPICIYTDATEGPLIRPCTASNTRTRVLPNFTWGIKDEEGDADMFVVDPDAANEIDMWAFQSGYRPFKSVYIPASHMRGDGTNCPAAPTVVTISNDPKPTFICTENDGSRLKFSLPMRGDWDAGTIFVKPYYAQTAADTGSVALEIAAACRAMGTAFNGTYGTEVDVDDAALVGSGAIESTLSGAITPNGTCAASDWLFVYIDVDAADNPTTAAATLNFIGADVFWRGKSFSHK